MLAVWSDLVASIKAIRASGRGNVIEAREIFLREHGCNTVDEYLEAKGVVARAVHAPTDPTDYKYITPQPNSMGCEK
jgi:hypothetical protein